MKKLVVVLVIALMGITTQVVVAGEPDCIKTCRSLGFPYGTLRPGGGGCNCTAKPSPTQLVTEAAQAVRKDVTQRAKNDWQALSGAAWRIRRVRVPTKVNLDLERMERLSDEVKKLTTSCSFWDKMKARNGCKF